MPPNVAFGLNRPALRVAPIGFEATVSATPAIPSAAG